MPNFQRRKKVGKTRKRRQPWYNKKYNAMQIAKTAWKGVKYIKSLINVEKGFFDTQRVSSAQTSTATIANLTNLAEGDDYNNRTGNSILLQSLLLRMVVSVNPDATTGAQILRYILFQDNDQRGTDPTVSELLEDPTAGTRLICSPLLHTVYKRFNVILDKTIVVSPPAQTSGPANILNYKVIKHFKKFKNNHVRYQSTAGADASNWEGAMYLLTVSADSTGPLVTWTNRIRYTDN